jgi:glycosyltransferase involved in cell wall biosynthesis
MKIAYVITRADDVGGAQVHVRDLAAACLEYGHEVTVLAGGSGEFFDQLAARGIPHRSIRRLAGPIAPIKDVPALAEIVRALRELQPDVVAAHTAKAGLLARVACAVLGFPAVFTPHGWAITNRISRCQGRLFRLVETLASVVTPRIINVCEFEARLAMSLRVAPRAKLEVVHNGIPDIGADLRADATRQPPRLVMIARMAPPKDHAMLLGALSRLKHLQWSLELCGDGPLEGQIKDQAAQLGIENRIRFLGFRGDTTACLSQAQIFVLASRFEAFPYTILEAMRAGLPVVASHVGGIPEAVVPGRTGLLAPAGDVDALAGHLGNLIVDADLRKKLGDGGRQRYLAHFTFENMLEKTLQIYEEVVSAGSAAGRQRSVEGRGRQPQPVTELAWPNAGPRRRAEAVTD